MTGNIWCRGKYHQIPQEHNAHWKTILTSSGTRLAEVNIRRGIFQGDSLSPLLFIVAMIPMTRVLERMEVGYQLKKGGSRINHLMFMDEIKLFGRGTKEIDTLFQTVRIVTGDIRMDFGIEKCALVNIQRGKVKRTKGIQLPDGNNIKDIDETGYKYLEIIEGEEIKHQEMKEKVNKEYIKKLKAIQKSKLNSGNTVKAINTWEVPVIKYSTGTVDWKKSELRNMDRKTRKEQSRRSKKKRDKYQDLSIEPRRLWDKSVEIVPIIIGALGTIPKSLKRSLEELGADVAPGLLQKSVVLETAHN